MTRQSRGAGWPIAGITPTEFAALREARNNVSVLASSWRRSLFRHQFDPDEGRVPRRLDPEATLAAQRRGAGLVDAANQTLDHLFRLLDD